jgi:homoserine dehydrogenase
VTLNLLLIGFGHVGRRFATLLGELRPELDALGIDPRVTGIVTARHGFLYDERGVDAAAAARRIEAGDALSPEPVAPLDLLARFERLPEAPRVMIETTPLDVRSGEPALSHVRAALGRLIHVVTANKGPAAFAYAELARLAAASGVAFLFEGAVMDGIPVFNLVRETLPASRVLGFRGVVNSTTNYIITALEGGESFDAALARMQAAGVAEADPSLDVDGWDAAAKAAALANVLLDAGITPHDVAREGLDMRTAERARAARARGRRLKLVASGRAAGAHVVVRVALEELSVSDPLANLEGQANAIELDTWPAGRIVVMQRDGGLEKTAYALVSDLATIARRLAGRP